MFAISSDAKRCSIYALSLRGTYRWRARNAIKVKQVNAIGCQYGDLRSDCR